MLFRSDPVPLRLQLVSKSQLGVNSNQHTESDEENFWNLIQSIPDVAWRKLPFKGLCREGQVLQFLNRVNSTFRLSDVSRFLANRYRFSTSYMETRGLIVVGSQPPSNSLIQLKVSSSTTLTVW